MGEPGGRAQQLHVVGMGKLGGGELNVSSDIDLVFVYPEDGETDGARSISNHEFFTRLGRRLIAALSEITEDGYVFRVDLRLRPYGDSGPLVASFEMLENYLITQGREWERYAWIKARALTGERGAELMELVRPFVFRRHLDYSAFASMRDLHRQVRLEVERRDIAENIKLGPGGIREIEFIVQVFQLIRGGRDAGAARAADARGAAASRGAQSPARPSGRRSSRRPTCSCATSSTACSISTTSRRTRCRVGEDRELVARKHGACRLPRARDGARRHRAAVSRHFDDIFAAAPDAAHPHARLWHATEEDAAASERVRLAEARLPRARRQSPAAEGDARRARATGRCRRRARRASNAWCRSRSMRRPRGRNPDATLVRMLELLESVSRRESYLALLEQYPQALAQLAELMSASPWAAQYLTRHPILLDELLDTRTLYAAPDWTALAARLAAELDEAQGDTEKQMDVLRHFKHVQTLRFLAQDLAGRSARDAVGPSERSRGRDPARSAAARVAGRAPARTARTRASRSSRYGKLGGKELGYASDLDLVFLYDDPAPEAPENYARLAQRVNIWLTTLTSAGVLYETDLRLRPDGAGGLLVSPLESFREYQARHAWPWEHQALTRARFVAGDARDRDGVRGDARRGPAPAARPGRARALGGRDAPEDARRASEPQRALRPEARPRRHRRRRIHRAVSGARPRARAAELTGNIGNLALLKLAARLGLIAEAPALAAHDAYRRFRAAPAQPAAAGRAVRARRARVGRGGAAGSGAAMGERDG